MPLNTFHPAVAGWFSRTFPAGPTAAQVAAWPAIAAGRNALVAAPTGSGKTLTAFLAAIDALVRQGLQPQGLPDETEVVYVSPLKALSNDIRLNLEAPLAGIREELARLGLTLPQFVSRGKVIASLPSLGLLTVAGLTPPEHEVVYREIADLKADHALEPIVVRRALLLRAQFVDRERAGEPA